MNPTLLRLTLKPALALALTAAAWPVAAQTSDIEAVRAATAKLIAQLVDQGVLAPDKGEALLTEVIRPAAASSGGAAAAGAVAGAAAGTVRVPYIPEFVRKELKDEIRLELAAQAFREGWTGPGSVPSWARSLEWEGDLRLRGQFDSFPDNNATQVSVNDTNRTRSLQLSNTSEDRTRLRFRGRIGLNAKIDNNWSGGVRLTTGSSTDPLSANQTLGNFNNRYTVLIDRAFIRSRYGEDFNVVGGRFANPWFGTDMMWANDLSFDGIVGQWTPRINSDIRGFLTLAALPIQEVELASADKWLFGAQIGATKLGSPSSYGAKVGLGYFKYSNMLGKVSPPGSTKYEYTAPAFAQKGNSYYNISSDAARPLLGLAAEYRILNLTAQADFPSYAGKRVIVTGDFASNLGFDKADVSARTGVNVQEETAAYHLRVAFGDAEVKALNQWQVAMAYKRIEQDALLDAFTDSDFRLGGTNSKGYILSGSYGLAKNTAASLRYFSGDAVSGAPFSVDVLQVDLNVRF